MMPKLQQALDFVVTMLLGSHHIITARLSRQMLCGVLSSRLSNYL